VSDIFREIDEDIRRENYFKLWQRYGRYVIAVAVIAVVATALVVGWREYRLRQLQALGVQYAAALDLAHQGKDKEAEGAFGALTQGAGSRALLARFETAAIKAKSNDAPGAIAIYDQIAGDAGVDQTYRDFAALSAARFVVDSDPKDAIARLQKLTDGVNPWHASALELTAIAQLKGGDKDAARATYQKLSDDLTAPAGLRARATEMEAALGQ
jgi:hypothetical protein